MANTIKYIAKKISTSDYMQVPIGVDTINVDRAGGETVETSLTNIEDNIGNLSNLQTASNTDLVSAINENKSHKAEDASQDNVHGLRGANLALGGASEAGGTYSLALGYKAKTTKNWATALGNNAKANGDNSIAIGRNATSSTDTNSHAGTIAIGHNAIGGWEGAIAIGRNAQGSRRYSVVMGESASAGGAEAIAIGHNASVASTSVAIGRNALSENSKEGVLGGADAIDTNHWIVPGNFTVNGTKNFEIPHPKPEKKATHRIRHGAVESPTAGDTLYRYRVQATKDNDIVTIDLPDYFIWLNKDVQIFVTPQGHFGNGYGVLNEETEQLEIHCQYGGEYNILVIGTRNDNHQSVQDWNIKGVEREIGESWTGETYVFSVDEIMEVEEIKEVM